MAELASFMAFQARSWGLCRQSAMQRLQAANKANLDGVHIWPRGLRADVWSDRWGQSSPRRYRFAHRGGEGFHDLRGGGQIRRRKSHSRWYGPVAAIAQ